MLSSLKSLFSQPAANPQAVAVVIAIVIVFVLVVAFVLIGLALRSRDTAEEDEAARRDLTRRRATGCAASLAIVVLGVVAATAIWYRSTSTNAYCASTCHAMATPARTWAASSHARITCVSCHDGSGLRNVPTAIVQRVSCLVAVVNHKPSRRFPVPDARCLGCHSSILDTKMSARNGEPFTHREVLAAGASCASCHGEQGHVPPRAKR